MSEPLAAGIAAIRTKRGMVSRVAIHWEQDFGVGLDGSRMGFGCRIWKILSNPSPDITIRLLLRASASHHRIGSRESDTQGFMTQRGCKIACRCCLPTLIDDTLALHR